PTMPAGQRFQSTLVNPSPGTDNAAQSTFTEELQFQGQSSNGALTWQAGAYIEVGRPVGFNAGRSATLLNCNRPETLECVNVTGVGVIQNSGTKFWFDTKALFAQASYNFTDQLSV